MRKALLGWYSRTVKRRAPGVHRWACRCASNAPLIGMRKRIDGPDNRIAIGASLLRDVRVDIVGAHNSIEIGDGCLLRGALIRIRGDGHRIRIGDGCRLGPGSSLWMEDAGGSLSIGAGSTFERAHLAVTERGSSIAIGEGCMFAGDVDVRTGDSHAIVSQETGQRLNPAADVSIGDHVWVAARAIILKGVVLGSHSIVATGAVVTKPFPEPSVLIAGNPAAVAKTGVTWTRDRGRG
jgi:acetyltransferase-like isoleucine patch superfamily enzyme